MAGYDYGNYDKKEVSTASMYNGGGEVSKSKQVPESVVKPEVKSNGKGTKVERSGSNPFYEETDFEHFDGLGKDKMALADSATKRVKGELARLYNEVKRTNPDAVMDLEFPPLPSVPKKGKKDLKFEAYMNALDQYRQTCEGLLEGVGRDTVVDEVRFGNARVIGEVNKVGADVIDAVYEIGNANLAATLGVGESILAGLDTIYNKVDSDTKVIISAVNANGQRIIRTIDKNTQEIKDLIVDEGQKTRYQEAWNSFITDFNNAARIEKVHRHITNEGSWIRANISSAATRVNNHTDDAVTDAKDEILNRLFH